MAYWPFSDARSKKLFMMNLFKLWSLFNTNLTAFLFCFFQFSSLITLFFFLSLVKERVGEVSGWFYSSIFFWFSFRYDGKKKKARKKEKQHRPKLQLLKPALTSSNRARFWSSFGPLFYLSIFSFFLSLLPLMIFFFLWPHLPLNSWLGVDRSSLPFELSP